MRENGLAVEMARADYERAVETLAQVHQRFGAPDESEPEVVVDYF